MQTMIESFKKLEKPNAYLKLWNVKELELLDIDFDTTVFLIERKNDRRRLFFESYYPNNLWC